MTLKSAAFDAGVIQSMTMPFPDSYRRALEAGTKNTTVRMSRELNRYRVGGVYRAESYSGQPWPMKIRVVGIERKKARDVRRVRELRSLPPNADVEIIRFEVVR